jgi:hypothetical protein
MDKDQFRRIQGDIRRVLLQTWDPIGIQNEPNAQDEYDGYVGGIYRLLSEGVSDHDLAVHLCSIVTDRMELPADLRSQEETVRALRKIQISAASK